MLVTISDIYSYAKDGIVKAGDTTRPLEQGEQLYLADHVNVTFVNGKVFKASCITSKINADPHQIQIIFGDFSDYKTWQCTCSCKAGAGQRCKHVIATLLFIYNAKELPEVSCTETEQAWGKRKKKDLTEVVPIEEFCHAHKRVGEKEFQLTKEFQDEFLARCFSVNPESEVAAFFNRRHPARSYISIRDENLLKVVCDHSKASKYSEMLYNMDMKSPLQHCCVETYNKLYPCDSLQICIETLDDDDKWMAERQFRVTGTRCYSLYTYHKNDWPTKALNYFYPKPFKGNYATQYGKREEANARNLFESLLAKDEKIVQYGLAICQNNPWLACSPDGILLLFGIPVALIEIKCPVIGQKRTIMDCLPDLVFMSRTPQGYKLKKRHSYFAQVQLGMCILNLKNCQFILYSSYDKSLFIENIELDEEFCRDLLVKLKNIFFEKMLHTLCNPIP